MKIPKPKASTLAICVGLFFSFVFFTFPFQNLRGFIFSKIFENTGIILIADSIYPSIFGWPGIGVRNVNATLPISGGELELASEKAVIRVGVGGLFPPVPLISLYMKGLKKGGDLYVKVVQGKNQVSGYLEATRVELKQLEFPGLSEPISGSLSADTDFALDLSDLSHSSGYLNIDIGKLKIPAQNLQGIVLPPMNLGDLKGKIQIKNGIADITSFSFGAKDSDIRGIITGELKLANTFMNSFLNLTIKLQVTDSYRQNPQSATLLSFLTSFAQKTPGDFGLKWSAKIADLTTNLMNAIPQPIAD